MDELIEQVKAKKQFAGLRNSVIEKVLKAVFEKANFYNPPSASIRPPVLNAEDYENLPIVFQEDVVKKAREILRKYFGVFLTNKVLKIKDESVLQSHLSTKKRDYEKVYGEILGDEEVVVDLGCGVNGFSASLIKDKKYVGVEVVKQLVDNMNFYFDEKKLEAVAYWEDLFELEKILEIIKKQKGRKAIWLFNVVDALENFDRDYSKKLIQGVFGIGSVEKIVVSVPVESISGKKKFFVKRNWLLDFFEKEKFIVEKDFLAGYERFFVLRK